MVYLKKADIFIANKLALLFVILSFNASVRASTSNSSNILNYIKTCASYVAPSKMQIVTSVVLHCYQVYQDNNRNLVPLKAVQVPEEDIPDAIHFILQKCNANPTLYKADLIPPSILGCVTDGNQIYISDKIWIPKKFWSYEPQDKDDNNDLTARRQAVKFVVAHEVGHINNNDTNIIKTNLTNAGILLLTPVILKLYESCISKSLDFILSKIKKQSAPSIIINNIKKINQYVANSPLTQVICTLLVQRYYSRYIEFQADIQASSLVTFDDIRGACIRKLVYQMIEKHRNQKIVENSSIPRLKKIYFQLLQLLNTHPDPVKRYAKCKDFKLKTDASSVDETGYFATVWQTLKADYES